MTRAQRLLLASLVLGALSCQRCSPRDVAVLERVPDSASGVVLLQPLGALAAALQAGLARTRGAADSAQAVDDLKASLGFDPATVEGWQQAGLDPSRPAAVAGLGAEALWLLPAAEGPRVLQSARDLGTRLWRADRISDVQVAGRAGVRLGRSFGDREVALATIVHDPGARLVLVASGENAASTIEAALATTPERSLARQPRFVEDRARVRPGPVLLWARTDDASGPAAALSRTTRGAVASLGLDDGALWLEARASLQPDAVRESQALLGDQGRVPDLLRTAGPDAVLLAAGSADVERLLQRLEQERSAADLDALARSAGLDLNRELLRRLQGGLGAVFYLADPAPLAQHLRSARRLAQVVGRVVQVEVVAELKPDQADGVLPLLDGYFGGRGMPPVVRSAGSVEVHGATATGSDGSTMSVHYAQQGNQLLVGTGAAERFDGWLQRHSGQASGGLREALSPPLRELLQAPRGGRLYLSFSALADRLRQLSDAPELSDPTLRSTLAKVAEPLGSLGRLGAQLQVEGEQASLRLRLELQPLPGHTP